jgi:hypothetical protein
MGMIQVYIFDILLTTQTAWLPKLPVPSLQQTMAGYLEAVEVAVEDEEQKAETRRKVERFLLADGIGSKLQELLIEKQSKEDNWVYNLFTLHLFVINVLIIIYEI